jgi:carbonic anhydrase
MAFGSFDDLEESIKASLDRLRKHPWLESVSVHGLIFDVRTGGLREVD